jgi:SAM-dependent methyltransferase
VIQHRLLNVHDVEPPAGAQQTRHVQGLQAGARPDLQDPLARPGTRRPDPRIASQIAAALGPTATVVNVGAEPRSYEPQDRTVLAVEPSQVMLAQRSAGAAAAVRAVAEALPLPDRSFDAALAILTVHHWADAALGLAELSRVARRIVVLAAAAPVAGRCGPSAGSRHLPSQAPHPLAQPADADELVRRAQPVHGPVLIIG